MLSRQQLEQMEKSGFILVPLQYQARLLELQKLAKNVFPEGVEWHQKKSSQEEHLDRVKILTDHVIESGLVRQMVAENIEPFIQVLGPDIDIQSSPHVRVSRPNQDGDLIDWHRDSFYGAHPTDLNIWFPLFPLGQNAGLVYLEGSHAIPVKDLRTIQDPNEFRAKVTKGSVAHQVGYVYETKTDDTISKMDPKDATLIAPEFGQVIFFFGCGVHRAQNPSNMTRFSIDCHIHNAYAPTGARPGFYRELHRGLVGKSSKKYLSSSV